MSYISQIVSNASSNLSLYTSFENKDYYYKKCIDSSILITSLVEEKLEEIVNADWEIDYCYQIIKDYNEKKIKELKEKLSCPHISTIEFMVNSHYIKMEREERREIIKRIHSLNRYKEEIYQEFQEKDLYMERPSFSTNITIMESNKLRGILRNKEKNSYLMNMSVESRNKRKNSREMNKLLFGKKEYPKKYNKVRKTKSPNNKLYY